MPSTTREQPAVQSVALDELQTWTDRPPPTTAWERPHVVVEGVVSWWAASIVNVLLGAAAYVILARWVF